METTLAIVGAGPYGLSLAAHAVEANLPHVLLGEPMDFWRNHMPQGMLVRSQGRATSLSHPAGRFRLPDYLREHCPGWREGEPYPKQVFLDYAETFQRRLGIDANPNWVTRVEREGDRFLVAAGSEVVRARNIVLATGLAPFPYIPQSVRESLPPTCYTHTAAAPDTAAWAGRRIAILGGGQSAFEYALLAAQAGAQVVVARRSGRFRVTGVHNPYSRLFMSNLCRSSSLFFQLPRFVQQPLCRRMLPTTLAPWVHAELRRWPVEVLHRANVQSVRPTASGVALQFEDGRRRDADHLVVATGYRVDLRRLACLSTNLLQEVHTRQGAPVLDRHFQSSVRGLYFAGAMAMHSFGPAFAFVCGVGKQCRAMIDRHLALKAAGTRSVPAILVTRGASDPE